jgi:hypothetical protein
MAEKAALVLPTVFAFLVQKPGKAFVERGSLIFEGLIEIFIFHGTYLLPPIFSFICYPFS